MGKTEIETRAEYCYGSYMSFKRVIEEDEGTPMSEKETTIFFIGVASGLAAMGVSENDVQKIVVTGIQLRKNYDT